MGATTVRGKRNLICPHCHRRYDEEPVQQPSRWSPLVPRAVELLEQDQSAAQVTAALQAAGATYQEARFATHRARVLLRGERRVVLPTYKEE